MNAEVSTYAYTVGRPVLVVEDISFSYREGDALVLGNLSFTVHDITRPNNGEEQEGELYAIVGKSGSGKSTLLNLLAGNIPIQSGSIQMLEHLGSDRMISPKPGSVGVVYQHYPLFEHMKVSKNLLFGAKMGGTPKAERQAMVDQIIEDFSLAGVRNKFPAELSGGQRQRVAIAQQILKRSAVIIFDEPFSGLDYGAKMEAVRWIQRISNVHTDQVVIVITHDLHTAVRMADKVLVLEQQIDNLGARIAAEYNLMEIGIAWRPNNNLLSEYNGVIHEIENRFSKKS